MAVAVPAGVRPHLVQWLALVACGSPQTAHHVPVAAACSADRVGTVTVTGAQRAAVAALVVLEGTLDDAARTSRIVQVATEALQWRGYARAKIEVTRTVGCFVDLHATVTLGPKYKIERIDFETADDFPRAQRLAALEDALGTVNVIGGVLIEYRLRRALDGLEKKYRDAGWLDVEIGAPVTRYDGTAARLTIPIHAGERYRVGVVRALGANAKTREKLLDELGIEPGGWYDGPAIRRALDRARRSIDRRVVLRASAKEESREVEIEAIVEGKR